MNKTLNNRIVDTFIFFCCYLVVLILNVFLGFGNIAFGNLVIYSIIFCALECMQLFLLPKKLQAILFFLNVYIANFLTSYCLIILPKKHFIWKDIFCIALEQYIILLAVAVLFSMLGYIIFLIKFLRKR